MRWSNAGLLVVSALALAITACESGRKAQPAATPEGVTELIAIDFAKVANYAAPALPAYFDRTVAALDTTPARNPINDRVATLGRVLFYDLRLSTNDRASCASCHQQALGFTDSMRFSNGIATARTTDFHSMRLGNLRYWQPGSTFWDRREVSVEAQVTHPLRGLAEMGWGSPKRSFDALIRKMRATRYYPDLFAWAFGSRAITETRIKQALAQFVRAMISSSSRWDTGYAQVFLSHRAEPRAERRSAQFHAAGKSWPAAVHDRCRARRCGLRLLPRPADFRAGGECAKQWPRRRRDAPVQGAVVA